MSNVNKLYSGLFHEISLATNLTYCKLTDSIIGHEDLGIYCYDLNRRALENLRNFSRTF
jgi:hypothetical protein